VRFQCRFKDSETKEVYMPSGVPEGQAADYVKGMPTYWGDQPIVAAPAYIGIVVFFGNYSFVY
jgi:hypothetical protein